MSDRYHLGRHSVFRHWNVVLGEWAARVSKWNDSGEEFYAVVPHRGGREWRDTKESTIMAIDDAIDRGQAAGEVNTDDRIPTDPLEDNDLRDSFGRPGRW